MTYDVAGAALLLDGTPLITAPLPAPLTSAPGSVFLGGAPDGTGHCDISVELPALR